MKAIVKVQEGKGNIKLLNIKEKALNLGEAKVKVAFTGICGTDLHIFHDTFKSYPPVVLGHESSGIVESVAEDVKHIQVGDRVAILGSTEQTCGVCSYCRTGFYMFCDTRRGMGHGVDGGFTKYVTINSQVLYKLPDHISLEEGALAEPLACAVQAVEELTTIQASDTVLVTGPGPIGLLTLALLKLKGCRIIMTGTNADEKRTTIAQQLGVHHYINVEKQDLTSEVKRLTLNAGVDVTIDCSGSPHAIRSCFEQLKPLGKHIQVGIVGEAFAFDFDLITYKQLQVFGTLAHSFSTWEKVMNLYEQNEIQLKPIITSIQTLDNWENAFTSCENKEEAKVLLKYE